MRIIREADATRPVAVVPAALALASVGAMIWAFSPGALAQLRPPTLVITAPPSMAPYVGQLERYDRERLVAMMRLVGLEDAGTPIQVFLAPAESLLARSTPAWIAGYADRNGQVVLFPERSPSYPHDSLQEVLQHETAHVLIDRAAGGRTVPRWFHEGVALAAERAWRLDDQARFAYQVAFGGAVPARSLDRLFEVSPAATVRAYSLSGALVQDLLHAHGSGLPARVLAGMRSGQAFDVAFLAATGTTVDEASDAFWHRRRLWVTWLPWLTSPSLLYALMTFLALLAVLRVRARRAARRRDEEPPFVPPPPPPGSPPEPPVTIH